METKMEKEGFFGRLKKGLAKTRDNIVRSIDAVFYDASCIDEDFYEELEEILIMGISALMLPRQFWTGCGYRLEKIC